VFATLKTRKELEPNKNIMAIKQRNGPLNERACQDGSLGNFVKVWMNGQEDICKIHFSEKIIYSVSNRPIAPKLGGTIFARLFQLKNMN